MCEQCESMKPESLIEQVPLSPIQEQTEDQPIIFFEPFELSTENLAESEDIGFDKDEFKHGLTTGSYYAGFYTALVNSGMDLENAMMVIFNDMSQRMNTEISKIQASATIEVAKNTNVAIEKQQL